MKLSERWNEAARVGWLAAEQSEPAPPIEVVFYADLFAPVITAQGAGHVPQSEAALLAAWARDAGAVGVAQGPVERWVGQAAEGLARRLPDVPSWLLERLIRAGASEAHQYLGDASTRERIQTLVASKVAERGPRVIVAHSLGSVVAWETLHRHPDLEVDVLLTLGSPLATPTAIVPRLMPRLPMTATKPPGVGRWVNMWHAGDVVAAMGPLRSMFPDVDEEVEVEVAQKDCHRARSYLRTAEVGTVLASAVR